MTEKKIALIIAGGVSLGSYEAGVLTELLYLLDTYNKNSNEKYVIDIITGGSAGSINGALTARIIMHDYSKRELLHKLWVEDADVLKLLKYPSSNSLFSSEYQRVTGRKYLGVSNDKVKPSSFAPHQLKLAFSLSNMVGIDYGIPYDFSEQAHQYNSGAKHFKWTFFSDYLEASLNKGVAPDFELWEKIKQGSIASGCFPIAFAPIFVERTANDFPGSLATTTLPGSHAVSDGGMFNNEPVKQAIQLACDIDGGQASKDRVFILIDPNINTSKVDASFIEGAGPNSLLGNIKRLITMSIGEAEAKDWLRVGEINYRLKWRNGLIDNLPGLINSINTDLVEEILEKQKVRSGKIIRQIQEMKTITGSKKDDSHLQEILKRIKDTYSKLLFDIGVLGESEAMFMNRRNIFLHMVFEINSTGSLIDKSLINLYLIGANKMDTAGEDVFALSGFFEKNWREHDYRLGRRNANQLIPRFLEENEVPREPGVNYENDPQWGDFSKVTIADANKKSRKIFYKRVMEVIAYTLKKEPISLNWFLRRIAKFILGKQVRKVLGL